MCELLPELRPYLEGILDDALAYGQMTVNNTRRREILLCRLQQELEDFIYVRLFSSLPSTQQNQFAFLMLYNAAEEDLQAFVRYYIDNIPALIQQTFVDFRARYVKTKQNVEE